jgi:nitronate monooxygenase
LLTAGAGGQTGWANPFAFARAVREMYDGIIVMAGGISDGVALHAAEQLGCDLSYMGTKFIATRESMAVEGYKKMLVDSKLDDVKLSKAFTGLETNTLKASIIAAGLDPDNLPVRGSIDISKDINAAERDKPTAKRWKDIWSAGHSVSGVGDIPTTAELIARTKAEYDKARRGVAA